MSQRARMNQVTLKEMTPRLWGLTLLLLAEVTLMAVGLVLGADIDGEGRGVVTLVRALLGQAGVTSGAWLWTARVMVLAIVVTVLAIRRAQAAFLDARDARGQSMT